MYVCLGVTHEMRDGQTAVAALYVGDQEAGAVNENLAIPAAPRVSCFA